MLMGQRIKFARKQNDLSQLQLADMIGVSNSACGQWERGHTSPTVENLAQLAIVLNVHFEWLALPFTHK